ncbi:MAG: hypothetical protein ETSY2_19745, partial [Candidatus Entotheonella gemina]
MLLVGQDQSFSAIGTLTDGSTQDLSTAVVWSSSNTAVATIDAAGLATALAAGNTTIRAQITTSAGVNLRAEASLVVELPTLDSIMITFEGEPLLDVGDRLQAVATGIFSDGTSRSLTSEEVTWGSSAPAVATIDATGLVTAVGGGETTITATSNDIIGEAMLTVAPVQLESLSIDPATAMRIAGQKQQFRAIGTLTNGSTQDLTTAVTWTSLNTRVATINAAGLSTTVGLGETTITATPNGIISEAIFTVVDNRFPTGDSPQSVAVTDLDGNGTLDLVTANIGSDDVTVLMGNGNGTFGEPQTFPVGDFPQSVAVADFDGNGTLDLVTANAGSDDVTILLGNGNGTFGDPQAFSISFEAFSVAVAVADFDGNGTADIVTANAGSDDVTILMGNGNGTFGDPQAFPVGDSPQSVAVGDFDGNRIVDIVTANASSDDATILMGNGNGTFNDPQAFPVGDSPQSVAVGDFDRNGTLDIVTANDGSGNVTVLMGNGNGTFGEPQAFPVGVGDPPLSVAVGDFDGNDTLDLVTANPAFDIFTSPGANTVRILLGNDNDNSIFGPPQAFPVGDFPISIAVGDFDRNGTLDLVTANESSDDVTILLGNGNGAFGNVQAFPVSDFPQAVATADFDGNGILDLVTANARSNDVTILLGNNSDNGLFGPP